MVHKKKRKIAAPVEAVKEEPESSSHPLLNNDGNLQRDRRARLIVRNLPFANLSDAFVEEIFAPYGNLIDVNLLKKGNGKFVGCGFVEYDQIQSAAKAIANTNGKLFSGRAIIVDWALPKNTFLEKAQEYNNVKKELSNDEEEDEKKFSDTLDFSIDTKPNKKLKRKHDENSDDDCEDDDENDDDDSEFNDEDDEADFDDDDGEGEPDEKRIRKQSNDVDEGKTVFIKNVPFSATNEDLKKCAAEFGSVVYALICVDKLTEHSKGSAFVKFKEKESADKILQNSQNIFLKDQALEVTRALSRNQLEDEQKQKKAKTKDSRNLYLVREGVVMAGSPAATTVSAADMTKRLQIEQWKTQILRNLNMFVSKYRLAIHNIPADYDDAKFRELVQKYSRPNAVIKEARVMQNRKKMDAQGQPLSKELGFVSFTTHEDALYTLRKMNNNPTIFTAGKRPIISFSIENREVMNIRQKRMEKSRLKVMGDSKLPKGLDKMNRKQRRFIKRKEKLIRLRQEGKKTNSETGEAKIPLKKKKIDKKAVVTKPPPSKAKSPVKPKRSPVKASKGKAPQNVPTENVDEDYGGAQSIPGKKLKMRSRLKLKKQAEIHKQRLKELKKAKKAKKVVNENKKLQRQREPIVKKKKVKAPVDQSEVKFSKIVKKHKQTMEKSTAVRKWYDN